MILDRSSSGLKGNCLLLIVRRFFEEDTLLRMRFVIRTTDTTCSKVGRKGRVTLLLRVTFPVLAMELRDSIDQMVSMQL